MTLSPETSLPADTAPEPADVPSAEPAKPSILDRWRRIAAEIPDQPALTSRGISYTYAEADRYSDLAALELVGVFGDGNAPIGLLFDHTAFALLAILTVLKTGRMHVFLDPHAPVERLRHYVAAAGLEVCLVSPATSEIAAGLADDLVTSVPFLDVVERAVASNLGDTDLAARVEADLVAGTGRSGRDGISIVFTSGSTGEPKGVLQTEATLAAQVAFHRELTGVGPADRYLLAYPMGFVAGIATFLGPLLNGAGAWCFDARDEGIGGLRSWLDDNRITAFNGTPFLARSLAESMPEGATLSHLRFLVTGGEAMTASGLTALRRVLPSTAFYVNAAGSSETGGMIVAWKLDCTSPVPSGLIPAGRPGSHAAVQILDELGAPIPRGEVGEIAFVSEGLSGGYWGDDERTAELFATTHDGRRSYRSGDRGRLNARGDLLMAGRGDAAVKVRGYLVEPSEIEAALSALDEIGDAVVVAERRVDKPTRLLAYVVPAAGLRAPSTPAIRRALRNTLPEYMIPSEIVNLEALPRTDRGKVDRLALPSVPERTISDKVLDQHEYVMAQIWARILEISGVGADDDFMALGGDSLSAEELLAAVREDLGVALASGDILSFPTLAEFTRRVRNHASALPRDPDVMPLNTGTGGRPLFCIAGAGALALTYLPLARQFPERDVYAFQAHAIERRGLPDRTLKAHAERVIRSMRVVQPHGPYALIGHSFGGYVALEVARQLRDGGEGVELVTLLDTLPRDEPSRDFTPVGIAALKGRAAPSLPSPEAPRRLTAAARALGARLLPDGLPELDQVGRHVRAHLAGVVVHEGRRQFDAISDHSALALRRHVLVPYDGAVLYVMAATNDRGLADWLPLLTGDLAVERIDTDHTSLLREPGVRALSEILRQHLVPPLVGRAGDPTP